MNIQGFGTIRNNTALKQYMHDWLIKNGFGTIRNNTALKQKQKKLTGIPCFGTIRNNTALKHIGWCAIPRQRFWNHSKQHSSKTKSRVESQLKSFWNHSKQHSSKTR